MDQLISTFSCSSLSSTTPSVHCLRYLRPRVILEEFILMIDFVVMTLLGKRNQLIIPVVSVVP